VLKAHPIDFAEKLYLFSLWDVPSAHDFSIPSPENPTGRPFVLRGGLVWVVPLVHEGKGGVDEMMTCARFVDAEE